MEKAVCGILIREAYKDFVSRPKIVRAIRRMVASVPRKYLAGLDSIVLTNTACLNHSRRRRLKARVGREGEKSVCLGMYHRERANSPGWIELLVDNIVATIPSSEWWFAVLWQQPFVDTLFHEIGHHIHYTKIPEYKEREAVADQWAKRLSKRYFRRKYWYLLPLWLVLRPFEPYIKAKMDNRQP